MHIEMASTSLFQFHLLISLLLIIVNPSHSSEFNSTTDETIFVSVYYGSVRPHSFHTRSFFETLMNLFESDIMSVVNLRLVPYGNAVTLGNGTVKCQDGPVQCFYNTIEACAHDTIFKGTSSFQFIYCAETTIPTNKKQRIWRFCCDRLKVDPAPIAECYRSGFGNYLLIRNGRETEVPNPPYFPWVIVNDQHISDVENLVSHVCNASKSPAQFKACQGKVGTTSTEKLMSAHLVNEGVFP